MKFRNRLFQQILPWMLIFALLVGSCYGIWSAVSMRKQYDIEPLTAADLAALDLSQAKNLMIVAHPDDETIWGGGHIQEGGYFIVCLTNGYNSTRAAEFQSILDATGNAGLILSYPDKVAGKRDDWSHVKTQLQADLDLILTYKSWDTIVTHNAHGEYGHVHHKMTHQLVTALYDSEGLTAPLLVFGKYYRAAVLPQSESQLTPLSEEAQKRKEALLQLYASQKTTVQNLSHMNPYEMWEQIRGGETDA